MPGKPRGAAATPVVETAYEDEGLDGLAVCAEELLAAIAEKNPAKLMEALRNFMDLYEMMPHEEASEESSED